MTAIALTIAGSDSGGGAGIQADLKTFAALGVYGASAITALTAQNTLGVQGVEAVSPGFVTAQLRSVASDLRIAAVKIGMLADSDVIAAVADALEELEGLKGVPVILDPVMIAASGDPLLKDSAVDSLRERLFPLATLITPNIPEAARLLGEAPAADEETMIAQGLKLSREGLRAVLLKGGHLQGATSTDILIDDEVLRFEAPRVETENTHGTGCTLSSAIAAEMAKGASLREAVAAAKAYLSEAIAAADSLHIGHGHGPIDHLVRWR